MEDLENVETDAPNGTPSTKELQDSKPETVEEESSNDEEELTDEQLTEEITRLKEEVEKEDDPKEKRYKEQNIWWKMRVVKERDKAKTLAEKNNQTEEKLKTFESNLLEEAYTKTLDDNFGLSYFENLTKNNPDIAEKLAQEKWWTSAKQLILDTRKELADWWDEELQKVVSEDEIRQTERANVYHELAIEQATETFKTLEGDEKTEAQEYFDDIVEGKKLTPTKAKKYAEMATFYATRNRKPDIDKDRILAEQASTWIAPKSWSKQTEVWDTEAVRQQLLNSWVSIYQVDLMYPIK